MEDWLESELEEWIPIERQWYARPNLRQALDAVPPLPWKREEWFKRWLVVRTLRGDWMAIEWICSLREHWSHGWEDVWGRLMHQPMALTHANFRELINLAIRQEGGGALETRMEMCRKWCSMMQIFVDLTLRESEHCYPDFHDTHSSTLSRWSVVRHQVMEHLTPEKREGAKRKRRRCRLRGDSWKGDWHTGRVYRLELAELAVMAGGAEALEGFAKAYGSGTKEDNPWWRIRAWAWWWCLSKQNPHRPSRSDEEEKKTKNSQQSSRTLLGDDDYDDDDDDRRLIEQIRRPPHWVKVKSQDDWYFGAMAMLLAKKYQAAQWMVSSEGPLERTSRTHLWQLNLPLVLLLLDRPQRVIKRFFSPPLSQAEEEQWQRKAARWLGFTVRHQDTIQEWRSEWPILASKASASSGWRVVTEFRCGQLRSSAHPRIWQRVKWESSGVETTTLTDGQEWNEEVGAKETCSFTLEAMKTLNRRPWLMVELLRSQGLFDVSHVLAAPPHGWLSRSRRVTLRTWLSFNLAGQLDLEAVGPLLSMTCIYHRLEVAREIIGRLNEGEEWSELVANFIRVSSRRMKQLLRNVTAGRESLQWLMDHLPLSREWWGEVILWDGNFRSFKWFADQNASTHLQVEGEEDCFGDWPSSGFLLSMLHNPRLTHMVRRLIRRMPDALHRLAECNQQLEGRPWGLRAQLRLWRLMILCPGGWESIRALVCAKWQQLPGDPSLHFRRRHFKYRLSRLLCEATELLIRQGRWDWKWFHQLFGGDVEVVNGGMVSAPMCGWLSGQGLRLSSDPTLLFDRAMGKSSPHYLMRLRQAHPQWTLADEELMSLLRELVTEFKEDWVVSVLQFFGCSTEAAPALIRRVRQSLRTSSSPFAELGTSPTTS